MQELSVRPAPVSWPRFVNQGLTLGCMEASQFKRAIGRRLAQARADKGWSLRDLEKASGGIFNKSTVGNYEQGTRTPDPWDARALAELLGVRASYLMCLEETQIVPTVEEEKLLRNWRALPENERAETARRLEVQAIRYRTAIPDEKVEHLSAKGKHEIPAISAARRVRPPRASNK